MPISVRVCGGRVDAVGVVLQCFKVEVGFGNLELATDKFIVNFVLHLGEKDSSRDNTGIVGGLELEAHLTVPHVESGRDDTSNGVLRHLNEYRVVLVFDLTVVDEVCARGVTQEIELLHHVRCSWRVTACLTDRGRHTRGRIEGVTRIARS